VYLIDKAKDMDKWQAAVNTIMNPWVHKNCKNSSLTKVLLVSHKWLSSMEIVCLLEDSSEIQAMPCSVYISFKSVTVFCLVCYTDDLKYPHPLLHLDFRLVMENTYIMWH
jgi:hypothetical protein